MPPHQPFLGHLLEAKSSSDALPPGAHSVYILHSMAAKYAAQGLYYVDLWPMADPMIVVTDPDLANQATDHPVVGSTKPGGLLDWFLPITNGHSLFTQNGQDWKRDRACFLPFFNNSNLDAAMPVIVDQLLVFREKLRRVADSGHTVRLEPLILALMNDIIGRLVLNAHIDTQNGSHPLAEAMLRQLQLNFAINNPLDNLGRLNPFKVLSIWNNSRMLNKHIKAQIDQRVEAYQSAKAHDGQDVFQSLLDVALESYFAQRDPTSDEEVDSEFLTMLYAQMRMFFFAGYDSTASTMTYCCYTVWAHREVLEALRAEHDRVLGPNTATAMATIADNPGILNALPYTSAVVKETMRLFPAANGIRQGCRELVLRDREGNEYPTEGCSVQFNHLSIMRNPDAWVRPLEFLPERFLVGPEHELYPPRGAWRPFEYGTRMCTGQALVIKEVKAFLVLMAREFDVEERYSEADEGKALDLTHVDMEKVYLVEAGAAHPRDQFPCRITSSQRGVAI